MAFALFKRPFERVGCTFERDGWVATDLNRGQRVKWCPTGKKARMGITLKDVMAIDALESQLRDSIVGARSQVSGPAQICAWARL